MGICGNTDYSGRRRMVGARGCGRTGAVLHTESGRLILFQTNPGEQIIKPDTSEPEAHLPFRLYADYKNGVTVEQLAEIYSLPFAWVQERLEAARLCIEKQVQIGVPGEPAGSPVPAL